MGGRRAGKPYRQANRSSAALLARWAPHYTIHEVFEASRRIGCASGVHRRRLNDGTAGRHQPSEASARRKLADRSRVGTATAHDPQPQSAPAIRAADLVSEVRYLASPELEGRGALTAGLARASDHVAARLAAAGLAAPWAGAD